ncbi:unnamed protein product [Closterium sp. Naga37s-1]|nr:unnamed protein product [Closterium sp. Naga37s-1]
MKSSAVSLVIVAERVPSPRCVPRSARLWLMALRVHPALPPGTRPLASVTVTSERNSVCNTLRSLPLTCVMRCRERHQRPQAPSGGLKCCSVDLSPHPPLSVFATRSGLFRSPVCGGVESATSAHGLAAPAVGAGAVRAAQLHDAPLAPPPHGVPSGSLVDFTTVADGRESRQGGLRAWSGKVGKREVGRERGRLGGEVGKGEGFVSEVGAGVGVNVHGERARKWTPSIYIPSFHCHSPLFVLLQPLQCFLPKCSAVPLLSPALQPAPLDNSHLLHHLHFSNCSTVLPSCPCTRLFPLAHSSPRKVDCHVYPCPPLCVCPHVSREQVSKAAKGGEAPSPPSNASMPPSALTTPQTACAPKIPATPSPSPFFLSLSLPLPSTSPCRPTTQVREAPRLSAPSSRIRAPCATAYQPDRVKDGIFGAIMEVSAGGRRRMVRGGVGECRDEHDVVHIANSGPVTPFLHSRKQSGTEGNGHSAGN